MTVHSWPHHHAKDGAVGYRLDWNGLGFVWTAIPLTKLTSFVEAGKTTLLNRILTGNHGLKVAVRVIDFGSVNIDADLLVDVDDDVMSLANGCV